MYRDLSSESLGCNEITGENLQYKSFCNENEISTSFERHKITLAKNLYKKNSCVPTTEFTLDQNNEFRIFSLSSKSQSLPPNSSLTDIDSIIINCLRLSPDDLANQITLLDFPAFSNIVPDEMIGCGWTKKNKNELAPNVVKLTKRFNHTIFWTVQEILNGITPKERAETIAHFIRVAKKLHELNNLHSLFAIISALKSASVYRLNQSWSCLSKKEKQLFERLGDIFNESNNWAILRTYLESLKLPCIPYLGLFLTDLVYIDMAFPHKGGLESEQRQTRMNNILRMISNYQSSDYSHIQAVPKIQNYLQSVRFIEELQNLFEDDIYKKSLKLEPSQITSNICSKEISCPVNKNCTEKTSTVKTSSDNSNNVLEIASLNLSPAKSNSMRLPQVQSASKFVPGHRKCRSLGTNIFNKISCTSNQQSSASLQRVESFHRSRHLLDDSEMEEKTDATSNSSEGDIIDNDIDYSNHDSKGFQGCLRRKTVQKGKKKPVASHWQRFWVQIWANKMLFFPPKTFKGVDISDYKKEYSKMWSLERWRAEPIESSHKDTFLMINDELGHVYKFRTPSAETTSRWLDVLRKIIIQENDAQLMPINLMSFE